MARFTKPKIGVKLPPMLRRKVSSKSVEDFGEAFALGDDTANGGEFVAHATTSIRSNSTISPSSGCFVVA